MDGGVMDDMLEIRKKIVFIIATLLAGGTIFVPMASGEDPINLPPVADAGGPYIAYEGTTVVFDASGSYDPDGDPLGFIWDLNIPEWDPSRFPIPDPTVSYTWYDDYFGIVEVSVFDDHGNEDNDLTTVTILNVDPVIESISGLADPVMIGTAIQLTASFSDLGIYDTHMATINWDDDTVTEGTINEAFGSGTATGSHIYSTPGVYTVEITIEDDDGGYDTEIFQYVVVYDPSDGFVTGGGWINSPEGAYLSDPTLIGKASFGFISKYKKGQSTPTGNTEFQFHAGGLNFHSSSYSWLVITNHKAMFKGVGTVNGVGNYGFIISVIDSALTPDNDDVDMFRIKIWDKNNNDAIIYDNQLGDEENNDPTTEIAGGQIVIHKK
ncbi:MAG: PKD domain-containing protein [Thermoplasmatota archaeon]